MRRALKKLRDTAGESFSEVLIAMLIIALAALLLAGSYAASGALDGVVQKKDADFYDDLSNVEMGNVVAGEVTTSSGEVIITPDTAGTPFRVNVDVYTNGDRLKSYSKP